MFQSWGASAEAMIETGLRLASIEPARVTVKVNVACYSLQPRLQWRLWPYAMEITTTYNAHMYMCMYMCM